MWHPVGELPSAVYWRRRLLVLTLLFLVLGGAGWLGVTLLGGRSNTSDHSSSATTSAVPTPALERAVPSLATVPTPTPPGAPAVGASAPGPIVPAPVAGGPCTDDMLGVQVRTPGRAAVGSKPTFDLLVTNVSPVPCLRALDKGLQEFLLRDSSGARVWGSNDCFPEAGTEMRTLAPGVAVPLSVVWGGLTSEPTCTAPRNPPPPGNYLVRGRLASKVSADAPFTLQ